MMCSCKITKDVTCIGGDGARRWGVKIGHHFTLSFESWPDYYSNWVEQHINLARPTVGTNEHDKCRQRRHGKRRQGSQQQRRLIGFWWGRGWQPVSLFSSRHTTLLLYVLSVRELLLLWGARHNCHFLVMFIGTLFVWLSNCLQQLCGCCRIRNLSLPLQRILSQLCNCISRSLCYLPSSFPFVRMSVVHRSYPPKDGLLVTHRLKGCCFNRYKCFFTLVFIEFFMTCN